MSRILALDYGKKRTGIAWTDPLQIIATGLGSYDTQNLKSKMHELYQEEDISEIVLGYPTRLDGSDTHSTEAVRKFGEWIQKTFPEVKLHFRDERFTSKQAFQTMIEGGLKKKKRRDKHLVNKISATIILQEFLQERE